MMKSNKQQHPLSMQNKVNKNNYAQEKKEAAKNKKEYQA